MAKFMIALSIVASVCIWNVMAQCPASSQVNQCSPKCLGDSDCRTGTKCCPNICNEKSCTQPAGFKAGDGGYKQGISSATGNYCGNNKCQSNEKCEKDKRTNQLKCTRH